MSDIAIRVEKLGKRYRIGAREKQANTLRESLQSLIASPFDYLRSTLREPSEEEILWALKDVSFEVQEGEVLGIVGRNGAGKSTLLKVLSRITEPTEGRAEIHGRVGSLLEVGTGFHPELTGRENIYMNGVVLGMSRAEITLKFDEIVAFAEVEKFIDTPVKRYSSGMQVRLGFAVAAHLEPEILLVDEVLAVGDVRFQRRCLDKMQDVGQRGRTVLFVSHNMPAITRLCKRAILLDEGRVLRDGPAPQVVSVYLDSGLGTTAAREWSDLSKAPGKDEVRLRAVRVRAEDGQITDVVDIRKPVSIEIEYDVLKPGKRLSAAILCENEEGICVFASADASPQSIYNQDPNFTGRRVSTCLIPGNLLAEGTLTISVSVSAILDGNYFCAHERNAVSFQVVDSIEGDSARGLYGGLFLGVVRPHLVWTNEIRPNAPDSINSLPVTSRSEG